MAKTTFVVKSHKDGWHVQKEGKRAPESFHKKKTLAVKKGRTLAKRAKGYLKIKAKTGKVQAKRYYGE
jgi:Na+-transporting NADH:ubiquinone oxidoreductase subunit NqrF